MIYLIISNIFFNHPFKLLVVVLAIMQSCTGEPLLSPKPRAFPKVEYPNKEYRQLDTVFCDFTFEYPTYAEIQQKTQFFDEKPVNSCWFDIYVPKFDCAIHCSYYPIEKQEGKSFEDLKQDAFKLTDYHNKKANYINPVPIELNPDKKGFIFEIDGPVASPYQFYLSDGNKHFLRGALYFNTRIHTDSLAPIYDFLKKDINHLVATLQWK